jgi:hypothetical protein
VFKKGGPGASDLLLKVNAALKTDYVSGRDCVDVEELAMMIVCLLLLTSFNSSGHE